jgi:hypothetical protein
VEVVLWLFVISLGVAFGAGIYEARIVIPQWGNIPPRAWPNTGQMFWAYVTTVPLTLLKASLSQWLMMNHGRHVLTLAGWLAALRAL